MTAETRLPGEGDREQLHELERGDVLELQAHGELRDLIMYAVGEAQNHELHEVERGIFARVMALGLTMVKRVLAEKGTGKSGATITLRDGREVPFHAIRSRRYRSVFGNLEIDRAYYWAPGLASSMPLEGSLNLPERCYSYLLREWLEHLGVEHAFEKAAATLETILGVRVPKRVVGLVAREAAPDVQSYYEQKGAPDKETEGELLVGSIDGKGVPMRRAEPRAKKLRLGSGEKPNKKKEAVVTAVYTTDRHVRSPEDVTRHIRDDATVAPPDHDLPERPKPRNKRLRATLGGKDAAFAEVRRQFDERDPDQTMERVVLTDGDESLQERAVALGTAANLTIVLDIMHVLTYLWSAAYAFHAEGSAEASRWVMKKLEQLLQGKVGYVIGSLRQSKAKRKLSAAKQRALESAIRYMARNRAYMQYDVFLEQGYPIGTGVVEGACRNLVRDRMELVGMHWTQEGAEAILALRAIKLNGDWEPFWKHRVAQERQRRYGSNEQTGRAEAA